MIKKFSTIKKGRVKQKRKVVKTTQRSRLARLFKTEIIDLIAPIPFKPLLPLNGLKDQEGKERAKWYGFFRRKPIYRFLKRIPVFTHYTLDVPTEGIRQSIQLHIEWFESVVYEKGHVYAVKLFKRVRDACVRFAADQEFERIQDVKLHEDGLPLKVGHLVPLLKSTNIKHRRAAIHVLDIIKLCEVDGGEPSIESIVTPIPSLSGLVNVITDSVIRNLGLNRVSQHTLELIIKKYRLTLKGMFPPNKRLERLEQLKSLNDIHMSVRKGPNGPALGTIAMDYCAVTENKLIEAITKYSELVGNTHLLRIIKEFSDDSATRSLLEKQYPWIDSRLSIKIEPWGKTRLFAICDWFTQSCCVGLHHWIFRWLEKQPEDGTMNQDRVSDVVKGWTAVNADFDETLRVYSYDLSKATDRLPALFQREILSHIFGNELAGLWYTIMTDRSFRTPKGDFVRFSVGQPLGAYSSWAMLALTHHVVCRTALKLSGIQRNDIHYVVIGDDVALRGSKLAEWYFIIMNNILQVEISKTKGFTPSTRLGINNLTQLMKSHSAELAKRIFINGEELTVVSPESLKAGLEYPMDFPSLILQASRRDYFNGNSQAVAPILLAALGYKPDTACALTTFPLRPAFKPNLELEIKVGAVLGKAADVLNFLPWFDSEIAISESELSSMWKWTIRSKLKDVLDKFKTQFHVYMDLCRKPLTVKERVYLFAPQSYVGMFFVNKGMLSIIELLKEVDMLNFQGEGSHMEKLADLLNTMNNLELALKGKPSGKRENLHRLRNRIISSLQPRVRQVLAKAKQNYGILLIDSGEQVNLDLIQYIDVDLHNLEVRDMLKHETSKEVHDSVYADLIDRAMWRSMEARMATITSG